MSEFENQGLEVNENGAVTGEGESKEQVATTVTEESQVVDTGAAENTSVEGPVNEEQSAAASTEEQSSESSEQSASSENADASSENKGDGNAPSGETTPPTPATTKKKWYEEEGAFPYQAGDTIEVIGGPDLIGRLAEVVKASNKKEAVKARLINQKDGSLQGCEVCLDFNRIEKTEKRWAPKVVATPPATTETEAKEPEAKDKELEEAAS